MAEDDTRFDRGFVVGARWVSTWAERLLAIAILAGVGAFAAESALELLTMDWASSDTFYELIYRTLMLVIGVELARTLITHDLRAILELLAFVIARKMLKPDLTTVDILLGAIAFVTLLGARRHLLPQDPGDAAR